MKKFLIIFILFSTSALLLISIISYANQTNKTNLSNYYPSPSGNYTKVRLINPSTSGPNINKSCFCAQNSNDSTGGSYPTCNTGLTTVTYTNAGTIFTDPTTGYLEICKNDGTFASYPGACFQRFGASGTCPKNYTAITNGGSAFTTTNGYSVNSWTCCYNGNKNNSDDTTAPHTKSGCFSTYSSTGQPAYCNQVEAAGSPNYVDRNAYDVGCDTIISADGTNTVYKRNCCYSAPSGSLASV